MKVEDKKKEPYGSEIKQEDGESREAGKITVGFNSYDGNVFKNCENGRLCSFGKEVGLRGCLHIQ